MSRTRDASLDDDEELCEDYPSTKRTKFNGDAALHNSDEEAIALRSDGEVEDGSTAATGKGRIRPWKRYRRPRGSMHDANLYRHYRPDFRELAKEYPDTFGLHVKEDPATGRAGIDWKDPEAMRELTRVMLRHDFGIEWDVPLDRLCPPVANRLNYICWLADLMKLGPSVRSSPIGSGGRGAEQEAGGGGIIGSGSGAARAGEEEVGVVFGEGDATRRMSATADDILDANGKGVVGGDDEKWCGGDSGHSGSGGVGRIRGQETACRGIDIGTGASCIYPLLGAKVAGWSFLATETDVMSAEWAGMNVRANLLQDQITIRVVSEASTASGEEGPGPLLTALQGRDGDFDFSMTNPPFFASEEEAGQNPNTATAEMAIAGEVACPGGEEAFVKSIIRDSLQLKTRVRWYTSTVGRKSNAKKLLRVLREAGVKNTRTTEFFQGRTVRWGLAWSFTSEGMVGDKVPDEPSIKVFSKKKTAEKTQHSLRSFAVPLRTITTPTPTGNMGLPGPSISGAATETSPTRTTNGVVPGGCLDTRTENVVKIVVPDNLPENAGEVVARMRSSLGSSKQVDIAMVPSGDAAPGAHRYRCVAYSRRMPLPPAPTNNQQHQNRAQVHHSSSSPGRPSEVSKGDLVSPAVLFAFELEVHGAAQWAGAAAAGASVQVWARLEDGGDRSAFQRVWDNLAQDVLRQNRRWRREMSRGRQQGSDGGRGE